MEILWDDDKNNQLFIERGIRFEDIVDIILNHKYIDILENKNRKNQLYFVIYLNNYIHIVPFIEDKEGRIFLKTIYPSRKFHKKYSRKSTNEKNQT
jgi:uncharacterized DUF497 family protein